MNTIICVATVLQAMFIGCLLPATTCKYQGAKKARTA